MKYFYCLIGIVLNLFNFNSNSQSAIKNDNNDIVNDTYNALGYDASSIVGKVVDNVGASYIYDLSILQNGLTKEQYEDLYQGFFVSENAQLLDDLQIDMNKIDWSILPTQISNNRFVYMEQKEKEIQGLRNTIQLETDPGTNIKLKDQIVKENYGYQIRFSFKTYQEISQLYENKEIYSKGDAYCIDQLDPIVNQFMIDWYISPTDLKIFCTNFWNLIKQNNNFKFWENTVFQKFDQKKSNNVGIFLANDLINKGFYPLSVWQIDFL